MKAGLSDPITSIRPPVSSAHHEASCAEVPAYSYIPPGLEQR